MTYVKCLLALALIGGVLGLVALAPAAEKPAPAGKINCLIITGQMRWHDIKNTTPLIKTQFEATGRFTVDVADLPNKDAWESAKLDFSKYGVVVINYEGEVPPPDVQKAFEKYMLDGGGLVVYHFAIATWPDWAEWNKMLGMMWHPDPKSGEGMTVDPATGKVVHFAKGEGPGSHHGQGAEVTLSVFDKDNPVTKGLPAKWIHTKDEVYLGFRGPTQNMTPMVTAFAPKTNNGTDMNEIVCWGVTYGKGRTFVNVLGHGVGETKAADTMLLLERGAEWAATGAVTIPVPADFPKAAEGTAPAPKAEAKK
jgi:uncharacterized protein